MEKADDIRMHYTENDFLVSTKVFILTDTEQELKTSVLKAIFLNGIDKVYS